MSLARGTRLGPYEIVAPIGAGGMGDVYRARDTKLQRDVAIKLLTAGTESDADAVERLEREARAIAALNHPNIVTIYAVDDVDGRVFLAMELVDGQPLSDLIPSTGLPLETVLKYAIPLADALASAHTHGITHRDLKPSNVMIAKDGRVKVLDFGLAKLKIDVAQLDATMGATRPITGQGQIVGTVAYMSPEQASAAAVDHRSDLFSLGVLLYEMATGTRPFGGDGSVSVLASILKDTPKTVTDVRPGLPRDFARIIRRALAKDPEQRYQTAKDFRNDLQTLKDDLTSGELAAPTGVQGARAGAQAGMFVAIGVAAIALALSGYLFYRSRSGAAPAAQPSAAMTVTRVTSSGKAAMVAISPDGRYVVHAVADGERGHSLWIRQVKTGSDVQIVLPQPFAYIGLTFSPDGDFVYATRFTRSAVAAVFRVPVLGGEPQMVVNDVDSPVTFSPDGARFVFLRGIPSRGLTHLLIRSGEGAKPSVLSSLPLPDTYPLGSRIAWSPDGKSLAAPVGSWTNPGYDDASTNSMIAIIDVATGTQRQLTARFWDHVSAVVWQANGKTLIVAGAQRGKFNSQIWRVAVDTGAISKVTNDTNDYRDAQGATTSPALVTILRDRASTISAGVPGALKPVIEGVARSDGQTGLAWTPDGRLLFSSSIGGQPDLWLADADGQHARALTADATPKNRPCITANGESVVFLGEKNGKAGIWRLNLKTSAITMLTDNESDNFPLCAADGRTVLFTRTSAPPRSYRINIDGGAPEETAISSFLAPVELSKDGRSALTLVQIPGGWQAGMVPLSGGTPPRTFDVFNVPFVARWAPDEDAFTFVDHRKPIEALWTQPIDGRPRRMVMELPGEHIYNFAWSRDGRIAVAHGKASDDVVLLSGIQ
jgi:Tol biopolymer transport system component